MGILLLGVDPSDEWLHHAIFSRRGESAAFGTDSRMGSG